MVWLKCESVGRPESTITLNATNRECIKAIAEWLLETYMGQKIRITLARTEAELATDRRSAATAEMLADLDSMIGQVEENQDGVE